jgi:hypothetical protein
MACFVGRAYISSYALKELKNLRYLDVDFGILTIDRTSKANWLPKTVVLLRSYNLKTFNFAHRGHLAVLDISNVESLPGQLDSYQLLDTSRLLTRISDPFLEQLGIFQT